MGKAKNASGRHSKPSWKKSLVFQFVAITELYILVGLAAYFLTSQLAASPTSYIGVGPGSFSSADAFITSNESFQAIDYVDALDYNDDPDSNAWCFFSLPNGIGVIKEKTFSVDVNQGECFTTIASQYKSQSPGISVVWDPENHPDGNCLVKNNTGYMDQTGKIVGGPNIVPKIGVTSGKQLYVFPLTDEFTFSMRYYVNVIPRNSGPFCPVGEEPCFPVTPPSFAKVVVDVIPNSRVTLSGQNVPLGRVSYQLLCRSNDVNAPGASCACAPPYCIDKPYPNDTGRIGNSDLRVKPNSWFELKANLASDLAAASVSTADVASIQVEARAMMSQETAEGGFPLLEFYFDNFGLSTGESTRPSMVCALPNKSP